MGIISSLKKKFFQSKSVPRGFQLPFGATYRDYTKNWYQTTAIEMSQRLRDSGWTTACIQAYCRCITSVTFVAQKWDDESGMWVRAANHPIEQLIDRPAEYMPPSEFFRLIITNLLKDGNALISIKDSRTLKKTTKLEVLHSDGVIPVLDSVDYVEGYKVTVPGWPPGGHPQAKFVSRKDMIHVKLINSEDLAWGISPLEALANVQDGETMAMKYNKDLMHNSGRPSFVLTTEDPLSAKQRRDIRDALMEDTARSNTGLPLVLMNGLKPVALGSTPVEMDYVESAFLDMTRICSVLGVPPVVAMVSRDATLANVREFMRAFYTQSVIPMLKIICDAFTHYWIVPRFNKDGEEYRMYFDVSDISELREEMSEKIGMVPVLFDKGYTMNEINNILNIGLPEIPTGNIRQVSGHILDADGWEFNLPVAPGGAPVNGSQIGDGPTETGGTVGLRPDVTGDPTDPTLKKPQARKKPFGRKSETKASEEDILRVWNSLETDRKILVKMFHKRVEKRLLEDLNSLIELPFLDSVSSVEFMGRFESKAREDWTRFFDRLWTDSSKVSLKSFEERNTLKSQSKASLTSREEMEIASIAAIRARQVVDTTSHWVIDFVTERLDRGDSPEIIVEALRVKIPELTLFRAQVIVENEVLAAVNYGNYIGAVQSGVYTLKTWRTQRDSRVRPTHQLMEGATELLSARYENGLRFPLDPEGAASEIVNCRCFETYE